MVLTLRLASVGYLHAPALLHALALCGSEFTLYLARLRQSLTSAAAQLALELMSRSTGGTGGGALGAGEKGGGGAERAEYSRNGSEEAVNRYKQRMRWFM